MTFGRRSNDALAGGRTGGASDLPLHFLRLIETMDRIVRQVVEIARLLRQGKALPTPWDGLAGKCAHRHCQL